MRTLYSIKLSLIVVQLPHEYQLLRAVCTCLMIVFERISIAAIKSSDNYLRCMFRLIGPNILIATICVLIVHGREALLVIQE